MAGSLFWYSDSTQACLAKCESREFVIGRQLQSQIKNETGAANEDILFDAGCKPERAWKPASIVVCRIGLLAGLNCAPLLALFAGSLFPVLARRRGPSLDRPVPTAAHQPGSDRELAAATETPAQVTPANPKYDAFISYRHVEPDRTFALRLLEFIEDSGFKAAFDERDFRANEKIVAEMERCIVESRYTLCIISPRYISSGFCSEEAEVCKTIDLEQRRKRLVPIVLERTILPSWFGGLVGIDFAASRTTLDPYQKLRSLLES
jgi:hypothetical protein